jgi:type I restriction enzyme S subunit
VNGWTTARLGDLAESVDYGVTASASQVPVGPKFLRITDIQDGAVDWTTVPWCHCDGRAQHGARLKPGDIVFARTGATTGKSFLLTECPSDAVFASYLIRVRLNAKAAPRFVSHFFRTPQYWAQITKSARGVAQPGVNASKLKNVCIPLPSIAEQQRIADVLERAEAIQANRRATIRMLDALVQASFLDVVGNPITNPKRWPVATLGSLGTWRSGGTPPRSKSHYFGGNIPWFSSGELGLIRFRGHRVKGGYGVRHGRGVEQAAAA